MPDFTLVPHATSPPTECFLCHHPKGPFVDPRVERFNGTPYICASCATRIGRTVGMGSGAAHAQELDELVEARDALAERVRVLEEELAAARAQHVRVVPLDDAMEELRAGWSDQPKAKEVIA